MITLAETYQRERQEGRRIGEQEGRHKTLLSERAEYVRLFWGEETSQAFRQRLSAVDVACWPSLSDLHAAYQAGRDPLRLLGASNGLAPKPPGDSTPGMA